MSTTEGTTMIRLGDFIRTTDGRVGTVYAFVGDKIVCCKAPKAPSWWTCVLTHFNALIDECQVLRRTADGG